MKVQKIKKRAHAAKQRVLLLLVHLVTIVGMAGLGVNPAFAIPPDPIDPDPVGPPEPFTPPTNGFEWSVPSRFGSYANGIIDFHWNADTATYDPTYVHPTSFPVNFDGCRTEADEIAGTSPMTYTWTLKGETTTNHICRFQELFFAQGTYPVSLTITQPDGTIVLDPDGRGNPFTQDVVVKDILIVSLGDSYASGEGSPDVSQVFDAFGFVSAGARWQDRRCHRSANAPSAQAALAIEAADPHTSVTFLSFACSGATINRPYYADASNFDPYRSPEASGWTKFQGTGILGTYTGTEPPDRDHPQDNQLPSQIDQMVAALTNNGQIAAPRRMDALIISGGGNDIGFGLIASLCTLYYDCKNYQVTDLRFRGPEPLAARVQEDIGTLPSRYAALASAIRDTQLPVSRVYITQYPDSTRNDQGSFCAKILDDVIPIWMQPLLAAAAALDGAPIPLLPYQIDGGEVVWAGSTVLPALNSAVAAAAQANGWTLVDGIADASANLFSGHGYCASDNWIRRASEATYMQGPWDHPVTCNPALLLHSATRTIFLLTCVPPATVKTTGTLHPTARGYQAVANRIFSKLAPDVLPPPPSSGPPPAPTFTYSNAQSMQGANGWLIGRAAGQSCPSGASDCALVQVAATVDGSTAIRGASLLINGARAACSASGVTTNGVTCRAQLTNAQTYSWSFTFTNDGIYRLDFTVSARNRTVSRFGREVKVDLRDPTATATASSDTPASGWYQTPVTVTLTAADVAGGSNIQGIEYQLDGAATTLGGNGTQLRLATDGIHTITYRAVDFAGRKSPSQTRTVKVDQTLPTSSAAISPTANAAGWNKNDVTVTLSTTDNGGSGIQSFTYSAAGAQPLASTTVNADTPTQLTIHTDGVTTITFAATDVAGNVEAAKTVTIQLDKTAPVVQCGTPDGIWHASDVSIACSASDNHGSGVASADANFTLTTNVPTGTETANAATGSRTVCDIAGNCAAPVGPISGNQVDKKAPNITVTTPISTVYLLNQVVTANYGCVDGGSGVASCVGSVASGSSIDTTSPGTKTFVVSATDNVSNQASQSVSYTVAYKLCVLYDQSKAHRLGSTVPIKLQLCDATNANVSSLDIVVHATGLTKLDGKASSDIEDSGNANPDSDFRYDATLSGSGGYAYNLSTTNLSAGTWVLSFTAAGDPMPHTVQFDVR